MAVRQPIVIVNGQLQQLQSGDSLTDQATQFQLVNDEAGAVVCGSAVYSDAAGGFKKAQANAAATSKVMGLVAQAPSIANGVAGAVALDDVLTLTTAQWDAVAGTTGGLTFNTLYYLDPANAGKITPTAPTTVGQYVVELGRAMSTVDLKINIKSSILL
jgi:hypothetical protein